jgi:hypothetical protein
MVRRLVVFLILFCPTALLAAVPASAQTYTGVSPPEVGSSLLPPGHSAPPANLGPATVALRVSSGESAPTIRRDVTASGLAFTGSDIVGPALMGLAGVTIGGLMVRASRRTKRQPGLS